MGACRAAWFPIYSRRLSHRGSAGLFISSAMTLRAKCMPGSVPASRLCRRICRPPGRAESRLRHARGECVGAFRRQADGAARIAIASESLVRKNAASISSSASKESMRTAMLPIWKWPVPIMRPSEAATATRSPSSMPSLSSGMRVNAPENARGGNGRAILLSAAQPQNGQAFGGAVNVCFHYLSSRR